MIASYVKADPPQLIEEGFPMLEYPSISNDTI